MATSRSVSLVVKTLLWHIISPDVKIGKINAANNLRNVDTTNNDAHTEYNDDNYMYSEGDCDDDDDQDDDAITLITVTVNKVPQHKYTLIFFFHDNGVC